MIFGFGENRTGCRRVLMPRERTARKRWESGEGTPKPFLTFAEKADMIDTDALANLATSTRETMARGVFHGSTDTMAASGLPSGELSSPYRTREGGRLTTATLSTGPDTSVPTLSSALERACLCARTADDNKARDIVVMDMRKVTPLYDYFVIVTGGSRRQIHTLAEEVDAAMHAEGDSRMGIEGYEASKWVVQDYGDVLVHVFDHDTRAFYSLEDLWADAGRVDWERA